MALGLRRTCSNRLALGAALVAGRLVRLVAAGPPTKHGTAGGQPLRLRRLGHRLLLFLERPLDASDIVSVDCTRLPGFTAAGDVRMLRVVRGLGHGLDEAAQRAALRMRFKPAQSDGRPVDSRATVHISFRLS